MKGSIDEIQIALSCPEIKQKEIFGIKKTCKVNCLLWEFQDDQTNKYGYEVLKPWDESIHSI